MTNADLTMLIRRLTYVASGLVVLGLLGDPKYLGVSSLMKYSLGLALIVIAAMCGLTAMLVRRNFMERSSASKSSMVIGNVLGACISLIGILVFLLGVKIGSSMP